MKYSHIIIGSIAILLLSGCLTTNRTQNVADIQIESSSTYRLQVSNIHVIDGTSPTSTQSAEHFLARPLNDIMQDWIRDRFTTTGESLRSAEFTIQEAYIQQIPLPKDESFLKYFQIQPSERFDGTITIQMDILDALGHSIASTQATVSHSKTVLETASLNDRRQLAYDLVSEMLKALDDELNKQMKQNFPEFLLPTYEDIATVSPLQG